MVSTLLLSSVFSILLSLCTNNLRPTIILEMLFIHLGLCTQTLFKSCFAHTDDLKLGHCSFEDRFANSPPALWHSPLGSQPRRTGRSQSSHSSWALDSQHLFPWPHKAFQSTTQATGKLLLFLQPESV